MNVGAPLSRLDGATLVLTRADGGALARRARRLGATTVSVPGLAVRIAHDPTVVALLRSRARFDDWIFSSPAAVRFAHRLAAPLSLRDARVFAVGAGTRAALAKHAIDALAPTARGESESLLALPALADVRGHRIAVVGAPGGRDLIVPALRARGAAVEPVHVYERLPPRLTRNHFDALAAASDPLLMLVSSGEALANLVALLPDVLLQRLRAQGLMVSSARLAALARAAAFADVSIADSAAPDDLLAAAARRLARHRL
ncbi:uroporphyrinogen-III synthase [Dokdonella sp.]|uniref:uroporphyrinogen-III synthase n=1 Tax=Dokdonella sp. TaxID=2291710 RepID=UPI003785011E